MNEQPPAQARESLTPIARAATALAVLTDRAVHQLRSNYREALPADLARQLDANVTSVLEASVWSNSIACWVEQTNVGGVRVDRAHDVAWPEWEAHGYHLRVERELDRYAHSGRREAYHHQLDLFDDWGAQTGHAEKEGWPQVEFENARNVTGTMQRDNRGRVCGVRFHTIFGHEDLWAFTINAADVELLIASWKDDDPWVRLASTAAVWAAGYLGPSAYETHPPQPGDPGASGPGRDLTPGPKAERPPQPALGDQEHPRAV